MTDATDLPTRPDSVPPPGATLGELLGEYSMTQAQFAALLRRSRASIDEILAGTAEITPEIAAQLEHIFGLPGEFWLRREADYRARVERIRFDALGPSEPSAP